MSNPRIPLIAGNWKMHKTVGEARALVRELRERLGAPRGLDVAVCPPFTALAATVEEAGHSGISVFAQNLHHEASGAFTGEVAPSMLTELGVRGALLGHSERRQLFGETDRVVQAKVPAALDAGLVPVLCVGETEDEREEGEMQRKLRHQVQEGLARVPTERLSEVVVAYEPIWAIGTGRVATAEQVAEAIGFVRALVGDRSREQAQRTRLLYGGSVTPDNAAELLRLEDVDGALVGGASLGADSFAAIVAATRPQ